MNGVRRHARSRQLVAIRERQVEVRAPARPGREPALDVGAAVAGGGKRLHDLRAHLAAARSEARTNGGNEVGGVGPEPLPHGRDGGAGDVPPGAPPARMRGGDGAVSAVGKQDRSAIGNPHGNRHLGIVADHRVGNGKAARAIRAVTTRDRDGGAVHLSDQPYRPGPDVHRLGDEMPLLRAVAKLHR